MAQSTDAINFGALYGLYDEHMQDVVLPNANKGIPSEATCSTAGGTAAKTVTAPASFSLANGATILVKFTNAITVANSTLAVGNTAAKPIYYKGAALEADVVEAGDIIILRYDGTNYNVVGKLGGSTKPERIGFGKGTCSTAAATAAKEVAMADFILKANGSVSVVFSNAITVASATLNINSTGAKPIYQNGAALAADVIKAGDIVTLCYNGTQFDITNIEHSAGTYNKTEINEMFEDVVRAGFVPRFNSTTGIMELDSVGGATIAPNSTTGIIEMTF